MIMGRTDLLICSQKLRSVCNVSLALLAPLLLVLGPLLPIPLLLPPHHLLNRHIQAKLLSHHPVPQPQGEPQGEPHQARHVAKHKVARGVAAQYLRAGRE